MIKDITIQNYKLFKSFHLKNLPQILVIGGKNNSGKTSVLEAIYLSLSFNFGYLFWRGIDAYKSLWFRSAYHNLSLEQPVTFEYVLDDSLKRKIQFEASFDSINHRAFSSGGQTVSTPISGGVNISYWADVKKPPNKSLLYMDNKNLFWYDNPKFSRHANTKIFFMPYNFFSTPENAAQDYSQLMFENNMDSIEFLKALQILEPKLSSLSIMALPDGKSMIYGNKGSSKIPLHLMGEGMNCLASILLLIFKAKNGIVLIDELENGFHYSILDSVWKVISTFAKKYKTQIIATTHSRELISGATEGIPGELRNDFQYRRIERDEKNDFKTVDYNFDSLKVALDADLAIR